MKDIVIDTPRQKFHYWLSWFGFIFAGNVIVWLIALVLYLSGYANNDVEERKGLLNKTWQKFIFVYGLIAGYIAIGLFVVGIVLIFV